MTRVLVTGADGQLGRALKEVAGDWLFTDVAELDITDVGAVEDFFARSRPDVVVNCAAWTDVDRAESEPQAAFRVNALAPEILAGAALRLGAALVHVSTDFVFDGDGSRPYTEQDTPAPINVYGATKLAGERAVIDSGVRGAVVRTSWLYSPWGRNFVKAIMGAAASRDQISVVSDQVGCPTSARSLAAAIVRMIPALPANGPAEVYHFCDAGATSRAGFATRIVRLAGLDCRVMPVTTAQYPVAPAQRPAYSALDTAKFTRTFGMAPQAWPEPLEECINEIKNGR